MYYKVNFAREKMWSYKTGDLLKEVQFIWNVLTGQERPLNTGDCLIEVSTMTGLTVCGFK
jgi:hypothetical protein